MKKCPACKESAEGVSNVFLSADFCFKMDFFKKNSVKQIQIRTYTHRLTLKASIATKVVCFSRLLKCLRSLYGKQCGPRSDCSYRSSLFWVHTVYFHTKFVSNVRQLFAADNFSRQHFQMHFFFLRFKG